MYALQQCGMRITALTCCGMRISALACCGMARVLEHLVCLKHSKFKHLSRQKRICWGKCLCAF